MYNINYCCIVCNSKRLKKLPNIHQQETMLKQKGMCIQRNIIELLKNNQNPHNMDIIPRHLQYLWKWKKQGTEQSNQHAMLVCTQETLQETKSCSVGLGGVGGVRRTGRPDCSESKTFPGCLFILLNFEPGWLH